MSGNCVTIQWRIQDFPLGSADLRRVHFLAKMYAKTKEMDPVGGRAPAAPPGSANAISNFQVDKLGLLEKQVL